MPKPGRERLRTPRSLAIALNGGQPRPKIFDPDLPAFEEAVAPIAPVIPLRERLATRTGHAELLVFRVGAELFATELRAVEEAVEGAAVRLIPDTPPAMLGIFALRDRTLPMYALARVLDVRGSATGEMTLVLRPTTVRIALAVDAVDDVYEVPLAAVRPAPAQDGDGMVLGVVWRASELITLLDADLVVAACVAAAPPDAL